MRVRAQLMYPPRRDVVVKKNLDEPIRQKTLCSRKSNAAGWGCLFRFSVISVGLPIYPCSLVGYRFNFFIDGSRSPCLFLFIAPEFLLCNIRVLPTTTMLDE